MSRSRIEEFDRNFAELHRARCELARDAGNARLYEHNAENAQNLWPKSLGTQLIRSASTVEQMINGITVRLWDDPFEWTLPESLPTLTDLIAYLDEVEAARIRGFEFLKDDADLDRSIPAPVELKSLHELLTDTLMRSKDLLSEAKALLSEDRSAH